jgi:hypothetical protein
MSEELKCPFCGAKMDLDCYDGVFGEEATFDCIPCGLTITGQRRFKRIAAAMDLAIATAAYFTLSTEAGYSRLQSAGDRVLEVFNG